MTNLERGAYEPDYDDPLTYDEGGDEGESSARSPLFLTLAVLVLAAFAAVVWVAYQQGVRQSDRGGPPVIVADTSPVRVPPSDPGGETVPDQDKLIYDRITGDTTEPVETLMPPPEDPVPLPTAPSPTPTVPRGSVVPAEEITSPPVEEIPAPPPAAETRPAEVAPSVPAEDLAELDPGLPAAAAAEVSPTSGAFVVQVGSYASDALAAAAWQEIKGGNQDLLTGLKPDIKPVDLGERGTWYRLRIGPFATRGDANELCQKLSARGRDCLIAKP
ncbi:MAG TPA: SPOR domain-containing protein [Micropepsaceae bacterium]|nr:SPOR domain-containing protein [Micropepsaceae bacterium]